MLPLTAMPKGIRCWRPALTHLQCSNKKKESFLVVPIHHPLVSQFTLEGFAVPAVGFIVPGLELIPGEKPDKRMKTRNITKADSVPFGLPVCRSTGNI